MARRFLPILFGGVLGALLVTALLKSGGTDNDQSQEPVAEARTTASNSVEGSGMDGTVAADQLTEIADPTARRNAALALLENTGGNPTAVEDIAAHLPEAERLNFRIHAIVESAARDPEGAIRQALSLRSLDQRRLALKRLAPALAATDPVGATALIDAIGAPGLKIEFIENLVDAWAALNPEDVFLYLETRDTSSVPPSEATFAALAERDPERLLALTEDLRKDVASVALVAALESLIEQDPAAALARIEALPAGRDQGRLRTTAVEAYASEDPEQAWSWAMEVSADGYTRSVAIRGIHRVDPDLAWEIMESQWNSPDPVVSAGARDSFLNYINIVVAYGKSTEDIIIGLDRILSLDGVQETGNFMVNLVNWANNEPESALEWSLNNLDRINAPSMLTALSSGLARTNPELARQTLQRLDEQYQVSWSAGVTRTLAASDLSAARAWTFEFPNGSVRDAGLHEVIHGEAKGGTVDRQLFDMFSSDAARTEAASLAARLFSCDGRTALALELAETYITDRRQLDSIRRYIEGDPDYPSRTIDCSFIQ